MVRDRQKINIGRYLKVVSRRCSTSLTFLLCLACTAASLFSIRSSRAVTNHSLSLSKLATSLSLLVRTSPVVNEKTFVLLA